MRQVTLCYLLKDDEILLGIKKRGFGAGKYNGFGGKQRDGETLEETAVRELREECGIKAKESCLKKTGEVSFYFPHRPEWDQTVHIYLLKEWSGEPEETEEMRPVWCRIAELEYEKMWEADRHLLPPMLEGKTVRGKVTYSSAQELIEHDLNLS